MAAYKDRVREDLDRWIAAGLVPPDQRDAILATLPEKRRLDAATALAWVGGALLGVAMIAFIAANWDGLPRIARFVMVLAAYALCAGGGAWAAHKSRTLLSDIALTVATLVFAAAIGLTGQIFDLVGEPRTMLYIAGFAGVALSLAGASRGAMIAALVLIGAGDFASPQGFLWSEGDENWLPALTFAAPFAAYMAIRWSSAPLAHASSIGILAALSWFATDATESAPLMFLFSVALAGAAAAARWLNQQSTQHANVFYGWAAWGALMFFAIAGYADDGAEGWGIVHRLAWLGLSGALVALGRYDRHMLVTATGVVSLIAAIFALLSDLGLDLTTAAMLFFLCALAALAGGLLLRRKAKS